jgi:hypothetical protein
VERKPGRVDQLNWKSQNEVLACYYGGSDPLQAYHRWRRGRGESSSSIENGVRLREGGDDPPSVLQRGGECEDRKREMGKFERIR